MHPNSGDPKHHEQTRRHPLCPLAHRLPAYRRGTHGAVQLALCPPHRRQVAAAHRGYRPRALDRGGDRRHPRGLAMAGARVGRRALLPVRQGRAPPRGGRRAARRRQRLSLLSDAGRAGGHATGNRGRARPGEEGETTTERPANDPEPLARPRSEAGARRREAGHPPEGTPGGRDGDRGQGAGPRRSPEQPTRRHDHPAQRRHADLQFRRGGGRPRHGRDPRDPRRRPPHQRRPPGADLQGHGLGRARLRPRAADPRARRRQAVQAPRRARHRGLPRHGLSAGGLAQLSGRGSAGATATTRSSPPSRPSNGSTSTTSTSRRAGSTSPSSPMSTATTSARPATTS